MHKAGPRPVVFISSKSIAYASLRNHNNLTKHKLCYIIQVSALSAHDGSVLDYHGRHG